VAVWAHFALSLLVSNSWRVAYFVGLIGISVSMRWASVLASLTWVIWLISLIYVSHFPVGWISCSGSVGCMSKTAFCLIVSPCVFSKYLKDLDEGQSLGIPGYRSLVPFGACTWDSYSGVQTLLLRLFHSLNTFSSSQVKAQLISIKSCSKKLFPSLVGVGGLHCMACRTCPIIICYDTSGMAFRWA